MYRENIYQFMKSGRKQLFIPKNSGLSGYIESLLPEIGVVDDSLSRNDLTLERIRGEDIPSVVSQMNLADNISYGITGDDLWDEFILSNPSSGVSVLNTYDWFDEGALFRRPALCYLSKDEVGSLPIPSRVAVNRKYVLQSTRFLEDRLGSSQTSFSVCPYAGDVESVVTRGLADCCVEVVYSGNSIKRNGLKIVEVVRFSDLALIGPSEDENPWMSEYLRIVNRITSPTNSYTTGILGDDNRIVKKVGEEMAEFVSAFVRNEGLVGEALDVCYSVMLGLARRGVEWRDIEIALRDRQDS